MTTLLVTKNFIIADRSVCNGMESNRQLEPKLYLTKDKRCVIAFVGNKGFPRKAKDWENAYDAFNKANKHNVPDWLLKLKEHDVNRYNEAKAELEKAASGYLSWLAPQKSDVVVAMYADYTFVYDGGKESTEVLYNDQWYEYGSGGSLALCLHGLGIKPEELMGHVSTLDPLSSKEYDLIYRKELSK